MSGPNPNENTIFWGGLTPEHLEITYKISIKRLVPFTNGQGASPTDFSTSLRMKPCCHSFILILPFLHFVSNAAQCQPWRFNRQFWNSVGYLSLNLQPTMKLVIEPASAILLYSWILLPMPPNASPGLSMGYFGTAWATCMISKCCHYKMAGLNLSTHHEVGDWASICHPFAFLDASPGVSMGHFGIACGYLYDFQVLPL